MAHPRQQINNAMIEEGYQYLFKHQILELFEDLCTQIIFERPPDVRSFLIQKLTERKKQGPAGQQVFSDSEIKNIFYLFDLQQNKSLSREQCKEALRALANSAFQHDHVEKLEIPDSVDMVLFRKLATAVLG